ncbi:MAG TPA: hypothetical protein VM842_07825, partial [Nitrospira sp.]|nr:hypothetical protein [Nitrospira sp.]
MTRLFAALLVSRQFIIISFSTPCLVFLAWASVCLASSPAKPLVTIEVHYEVSAAGAVELIWGVNGWHPVKEEIRPQGTKLRNGIMPTPVMSTPMLRSNDAFTATIRTEVGAIADYKFLITKTAGEAPVEIWDEDDSYRLMVNASQMLLVKPRRIYQFYGM